MKRLFTGLIITAYFLGVTGCATLADTKLAQGTGTVRTYDKSYDTVWDAALIAVRSNGLDLKAHYKGDGVAHTGQGVIYAQGGVGPFNSGENIAVFVDRVVGSSQVRVEVVHRRAIAAPILAIDWENRLITTIDKWVNMSPE